MSFRASFGLSPRVASSQRGAESSSSVFPRLAASPKIVPGYQPPASFVFPAPATAAAQFASQNGHQRQQQSHHASNGYSTEDSDGAPAQKRRGGPPQHSQHYSNGNHSYDPYTNGHSSSSEGEGNGKFAFAPYPSSSTSQQPQQSHHPRFSPLRRDHEPDELNEWKAQQAAVDAHHQWTKRVKYGLATLVLAAILALFYMLGQHSGSSTTQVSLAEPNVNSGEANGMANAPQHSVPLDPHASEADKNARMLLAELTAHEVAREKDALYELDPSAVSHPVDPKDAESVARLDPVSRATVVVPRPGAHLGGQGDAAHDHDQQQERNAHPAAQMQANLPVRAPRAHNSDDEDPDLLRRLAETQAMNQLELEKNANEAAYLPRRQRVVHEGAGDLGSDSLVVDDYLQRVPAHPQPNHASHVVIEQLIHERATDANNVKPHPHKDHPNVPKVGRGIPSIPMPVDPKANKKPAAAPAAAAEAPAANPPATPAPSPAAAPPVPAEPAASTPAPAATTSAPPTPAAAASTKTTKPAAEEPASSTRGRKRDAANAKPTAAAATAEETTESAEPEAADSSEDELLSELSKASRPAEVHAESEEVASKLNKKTGLKGPVLRGANADAQAEGPADGAAEEEEAVEQKPKAKAGKDAKKKAGSAGADDTAKLVKGKTKVAALEFQEKQQAQKAWAAIKGSTLGDLVETVLPEEGSAAAKKGGVLFGADVQLVVLTNHKNQALARKVKALYAPLVKRLTFMSDARDNGLNATVLTDPHKDDWAVKSAKEQPWRVYELFRALMQERKRLGEKKAPKFYLVMKDTTFPLLDQIRWKLQQYTEAYKGLYPNFAGGRKGAQAADNAYYTEQQEQVSKTYGGKKLMVAPTYMWGFDAEFLESVSDFSSASSCALLGSEALALAGLVECAGGALERTEYDLITQTRSNHREKKIHKDTAPLSEWRQYDAFNGCNTPGMLQEAYDAYYGKLKKGLKLSDDE